MGKSRRSTTRLPIAVIDPGTAEDLVGGVGWWVVYVSRQTEALADALNGTGTITLSKVDAILAVIDSRGKHTTSGLWQCHV